MFVRCCYYYTLLSPKLSFICTPPEKPLKHMFNIKCMVEVSAISCAGTGAEFPAWEGLTACVRFPRILHAEGMYWGLFRRWALAFPCLLQPLHILSRCQVRSSLPRPLLKAFLADAGIRTLSFWTKQDGPKPFPSKTAVTSNGIAVTLMSPFTCFTWLCAANSFSTAVGAIPVQQRPPLAGTGQLCPALGLLLLGWMGLCVQKVRSLSHFCHLPEGEIIPAYNYHFFLSANLGT